MSFQVFVCACDKYNWIYPDFIRYANSNLPYEYSFWTENIYDENHNILPTYREKWYERMLYVLNILKCRDVIYLQEDFIILSVDKEVIEESYNFHKRKNSLITKLGNNYEFRTYPYPERIGRFSVSLQDKNDEYLMSHQPVSIFNREFLIASLEGVRPDGPSKHEILGSNWMRACGSTKVFCIGESHRPKNYSEIFHIEHAIRKGEILEDSKKYLGEYK